MARLQDRRRIMDTMLTDPRMRLCPLAARALYVLLADAMLVLPEPGVLRFGTRIGTARDVAALVSVPVYPAVSKPETKPETQTETQAKPNSETQTETRPETEIETHLETLFELGFLVRMSDGAWALPASATGGSGGAKAQKASENGTRGGRPRAGETADQARARRARDAAPAPAAQTQETAVGILPSHARAHTAAACLASASEKEASKQQQQPCERATDGADPMEVAREVADLAGMDDARGAHDFRPVMTWLAAGVDADTIREVVSRVAERPGYAPPRTLGYFTAAVMEASAATRVRAPSAAAVDPAKSAATKVWLAAMEDWKAAGRPGNAPTPPAHLGAAA